MNDNTKLRIKVSKRLFESIAREVLAEAKGGDYAMRETKKMMKPKKGGTKKLEEMDEMKQPKMEMNAPEKVDELDLSGGVTHLGADQIFGVITQILGAAVGLGITASLLFAIAKESKSVGDFIKNLKDHLKKKDPSGEKAQKLDQILSKGEAGKEAGK